MREEIPVIDFTAALAGEGDALRTVAREVREALTNVGFLVLTGHDVPQSAIDRTFADAKRLHELPMERKLALRMNEHNNGYMAMNRYAVWTSEVNRNDKPDLNEAFFLGPQIDTVIECLPGCASVDRPAQWPPISYGDWLAYWNSANYDPKAQKDVAA